MESECDEDIRLLNRLTRMKLNIISKRLKSPYVPQQARRRPHSPEFTSSTPSLCEKNNDKIFQKFDRRNELLQKLWEELDESDKACTKRFSNRHPSINYERNYSLIRNNKHSRFNDATEKDSKIAKNDLLELMLIQNAHMQQWLFFQTLQRNDQNQAEIHNHYYESTGKTFSRNFRSDVGSQYPQDFFDEHKEKSSENEDIVATRQESPPAKSATKSKQEKKRR